jgi:hypothetical protein
MKFNLEINSEDDALAGNEGRLELARILRDVADRVLRRENGGKVRDENGNSVGRWSVDTHPE